jgi:hypothetical protein
LSPIEYKLLTVPSKGIREIDKLIECHNHVIEFYKNRECEIHNEYTLKINNELYCETYAQDYGEELTKNNELLPFIHNKAHLITLYSLFESVLNDISNFIDIAIFSDCKFSDFKEKYKQDKGVFLYLKFLKLTYHIKINQKIHNNIIEFNKIRNTLVHANGNLKINQKINSKLIDVIDNKIVNIDNAYIINLCSDLKSLLNFIGDRLIHILQENNKSLNLENSFFCPRYAANT